MKKEIKRGIAITLGFLLILLAVDLLFSCCSPKIVERVETKVEVHERVVHDTTTFEIPVEVEKIVTRDTVSHLENTYARSDASVSGGMLSHSLESIPQIIKVPYEVVVTDTLFIEKQAVETIKEVKVEKPLSWWQKFRIWAFFPLLLAVLYLGRKYIWKFIELILKLI